jgi:cell division protein FtsQ
VQVREAPPRRRWIPPLILGVITVVVLAAYFTPLLGVRSVQVTGLSTLPQQEVAQAAGVELGTPMLRLNADEIRERLRTVPKIASSDVELVWPSTVRLKVVEHVPVAFTASGGQVRLVAISGVVVDALSQPPEDLPELQAPMASPLDSTSRAGLDVVAALPRELRSDVATVVPQSPESVTLLLKGGREVHWGSPEDSARKAVVLPPLLTRPGKIYDVTTPALPTVS